MGWKYPIISTNCKIIQREIPKFISPLSTLNSSSSSCPSFNPPPPPQSLPQRPIKNSSTTNVICSSPPSTKVVEVAMTAGCFGKNFFVSLIILAFIISAMMWLSTTYEPPPEVISLRPSNSEPMGSRGKRDRIRFANE
ncbi:hypothetical protein PV328_002137 [Microctonus aethiopoides]|uniref:Transmembrane protein n=1 Tax=Microctonus aethiopoides TaxID=144406 RepID=A0AA39FZ70_9HYME|nr:hypothetical protein PV328_002137 [Microctonus aethiopoides]